ncbi:MAG: fasciclin domain-containing protein [Gemmatimonadaceae bacterium]
MKKIVQIAAEAGSFNALVTTVKAAGLAETLQGAGPFTAFAPTDAAFAKLPAGTVEALLADKVMAGDIVKAHGAKPRRRRQVPFAPVARATASRRRASTCSIPHTRCLVA